MITATVLLINAQSRRAHAAGAQQTGSGDTTGGRAADQRVDEVQVQIRIQHKLCSESRQTNEELSGTRELSCNLGTPWPMLSS